MKQPLHARVHISICGHTLTWNTISHPMSPSKPTYKGWQVACEKQGNTHQALSEFHRTIEGRRKEKPRLCQNKRGERKKKKKGGRDGWGQRQFQSSIFSPLLPIQAAACLFSSLLVVLFLLLSLTHSLFPLAAALRQGVENKRYNALPLLLLPLLPISPTLLFWSPCTEHALLPVLSLNWDTLSSLFCLFSFTPHEWTWRYPDTWLWFGNDEDLSDFLLCCLSTSY